MPPESAVTSESLSLESSFVMIWSLTHLPLSSLGSMIWTKRQKLANEQWLSVLTKDLKLFCAPVDPPLCFKLKSMAQYPLLLFTAMYKMGPDILIQVIISTAPWYFSLTCWLSSLYNNPSWVLSCCRFWTKKKFARLRLEVDRADWMDNSVLNVVAVVNAFYSGDTNSLVLPAGFMGGLFFNPKAPQFMNHAGIGVVAGHEVSHGFDDRGRQQDETGTGIK